MVNDEGNKDIPQQILVSTRIQKVHRKDLNALWAFSCNRDC